MKEFRWYVQPFWRNTRVWRTDGRTDGQTDGRTDGIGVAYTRHSIYAVARKNQKERDRVHDQLATSHHERDGSIYRLIRGLKLSCLSTLIEAKSINWEDWLTTLKRTHRHAFAERFYVLRLGFLYSRTLEHCYVRFYGFTAWTILENFYVNQTSFIWN